MQEKNRTMEQQQLNQERNEIKGNNNVDRSDDTEDLSPSVKYTTSKPDQSEPDLSNTIPSVSAKSANMPILPPNPVLDKQFKEELIRLSMTSATMKGVSIKMEMKKGTRVNKARKMFGRRFKVPWTDLKYFMGNTELIGMELVDGFDGIDIKVYGPAK